MIEMIALTPKDSRDGCQVESGWFQGLGAAVIAMNAVVMGGCLREMALL